RFRPTADATWSVRPRTSPSGIFLSSRNDVCSAQPGDTRRVLVIASAAVNDLMASSPRFLCSQPTSFGCDRADAAEVRLRQCYAELDGATGGVVKSWSSTRLTGPVLPRQLCAIALTSQRPARLSR